MKIMRRLFIAMLASSALVGAAVAADANVAGEWDFTVETQAGTGTPHFSLKQDGASISGTYKGALGEAPVTGSVKGNAVVIQFRVEAQGMEMDVIYKGTVDGAAMSGTVTLGDFGEGKFTGKKK
jgi:hypothetical protein